MTAPNGPILFNNSTGSDTAASGLGPAIAETGSGASTTAASAVVTGITTTGVTAGDLLWVQSSSGRQFSIIASVDSGTQVTCDDTFANTESSRTWAIGGKRQTVDNTNSRRLFGNNDAKAGWIIETETDQTISSSLVMQNGDTTNGYVQVRGSGASRKTITQTANAAHFEAQSGGGRFKVSWLTLENTNGTKTNSIGIEFTGGTGIPVAIDNCVFGHATNNLRYGIARTGGNHSFSASRCAFIAGTSAIYSGTANTSNDGWYIDECKIIDCTGAGIDSAHAGVLLIASTVIAGCGGDGVNFSQQVAKSPITIKRCLIQGNSGDGIDLSSSSSDLIENASIFENVLVANGGYGITVPSGFDDVAGFVDHNAFYDDTSGQRNNLSAGTNDITMTADPFVDAAADDFNVNDTSGGGTLLRAETVTL